VGLRPASLAVDDTRSKCADLCRFRTKNAYRNGPASSHSDRSRRLLAHDADDLERSLGRGLPPGPARLYRALAAEIEREAREHRPDPARRRTPSADETVATVESLFAEALAAGPRADSLDERRALLREGNLAHVRQVRGYYARPWAEGDAEAVVRTFVCECGDRTCVASVELTVGAASAKPVLAAGHG
jgi:hypothetical protein